MEVLQARIDSFKKSKRVKNPNKPSSSATVRWPHPLDFKANPETLADAGFFYNPSYEGRDSVSCYVCDKELEDWEKDDDPHVIHWEKCGQTCCWAIVRCGLPNDMDKSSRFVFTDKTRVPTHKLMEKARFDTFDVGKGWIHDQVKNHGANSKMMARAGFVYTPQQSNDDLVTCLYCDTSLSGWDADDDPMEEHRRREKSCPFFSATVSKPAPTNRARSQSRSAKPPSKSKPPTRSTSKSKHQDILLPTKTDDIPRKSSRPKVMSDVEPEPEPEPETVNHVYPAPSAPQRPLPQTPPKKVVTPPPKTVPSTAAEPEVVNHVHPEPLTTQRPLPQTPPQKVIPPPTETVPSTTVEPETVNHVYPDSLTPQHPLPQTPPKKVITPPPKMVPSTAFELIPALSKLPITPIHALTEAELDMTVEEWVRYQIDVEYDKFRRDGERELQRFRNQAEEVRKAIEGL